MHTDALQTKILDQSEALSLAINNLELKAKAHAEAEHAYRQARALAYTGIVADTTTKRTVDHINAMVDLQCDMQMLRVRLAEAEHEAASELVKTLRQQLSAGQSLLNAVRAEAEAVAYRQTQGA